MGGFGSRIHILICGQIIIQKKVFVAQSGAHDIIQYWKIQLKMGLRAVCREGVGAPVRQGILEVSFMFS